MPMHSLIMLAKHLILMAMDMVTTRMYSPTMPARVLTLT